MFSRKFIKMPAPRVADGKSALSSTSSPTLGSSALGRLPKPAALDLSHDMRGELSSPKPLQTSESICSNSSQLEYASPTQTIIIFDWDDTLCPSHFIRINRPRLHYFQPCPNDPKFKVPLATLADLTIKALREASKFGKVIILTNAQPQWVEISCRNFLPGVWNVIKELNIDIVYARMGFENELASQRPLDYDYNMNAPQLWKEKAMREHLNRFYSRYVHQSWKNIVSIGDQACEHNACRLVAENRPTPGKQCRIKTVKLLEEPLIEDLISELQVIIQWLPGLATYNGGLDLDLSADEQVIFETHSMLVKAASPPVFANDKKSPHVHTPSVNPFRLSPNSVPGIPMSQSSGAYSSGAVPNIPSNSLSSPGYFNRLR